MMGVMQDPAPPYTRITDGRLVLSMLSHGNIQTLSMPLYRFKLPYRWRLFRSVYDDMKTDWVPVINQLPRGLLINVALYGAMVAGLASSKAETALGHFHTALEEVALNEIVEVGQLLCIDNRVALHSRTPFKASFDGSGRAYRWVQRLFVTDDIDNFSDWGKADDAVFVPTFGTLPYEPTSGTNREEVMAI